MDDTWRRGDGRVEKPKFPKKPNEQWRKGYRAGIAAMLMALNRACPTRFLVNGAVVYVFAGHHIDTAADAAEDMAPKSKRAKSD